MKLIDKSALVAEIERRRQELRPTNTHQMKVDEKMDRDVLMWLNALAWVKKLLNTLEVIEIGVDLGDPKGDKSAKYIIDTYTHEVKEIDLEKSISDWLSEGLPNDEELIDYIKETAEHFFELGISVNNSTKVTTPDVDDVLKENGVNPDSKEAKIIKESYFMAIEKLAQKGE